MIKDYKHIFFDMDGTLTESRSAMSDAMRSVFAPLIETHDVAVISGATLRQMHAQIPFLHNTNAIAMGQSGNDVRDGHDHVWTNRLSTNEIDEIHAHIKQILRYTETQVTTDLIENRGAQVSLSLIGHSMDRGIKKTFDADGAIRREILENVPFTAEGLQVRIGGTTCLDYTREGWGKRGNIEKFVHVMGWDKKDCVYVGDQLYKGGNDEDMIGCIDTVVVSGPRETYDLLCQ